MKQKIHQVNAGENEQRIEIYKCIQLNTSLRFVLSLNPLTFSDAIVKAIDILLDSFAEEALHHLVSKLHNHCTV